MARDVRAATAVVALFFIPRAPKTLFENSFVLSWRFCAKVPSCLNKC